jgi:hypothetical protein
MLLTERIQQAKQFVTNSLVFSTAKSATTLTIPLSDTVVSWLVNKNVAQIWACRLAAEFFISIYLRDVVAKRAPGIDGYDPASGTPVRLFTDSTTTAWFRSLAMLMEKRIVFLDEFLYTYLCAATAGELRHAPSKASGDHSAKLNAWWITHQDKAFSRAETQKRFLTNVTRAQSREYLATAWEIFRKHTWGGGYGGGAWATIAETGLHRAEGKLDPVSFIDRVFDLKHNNGPMFDKNSIVEQSNVHGILNAKFAATKDTDWRPWLRWTSKPLYTLIVAAQSMGLWTDPKVIPGTGTLVLPEDIGPVGVAVTISDDDDDSNESSEEAEEAPSMQTNKFLYAQKRLACPKGNHGS